MSVTFIPNEEVVAVFCIFWSVSPYIYTKSMEIIVQKRDKTSAVSVIHVYLRSTDLIFLLAKSHCSYSRSMIWQKLFRIFSSMTVNSREKKTTLQGNFHPSTVFDFILNSKQTWKSWKRQFDDLSVRKDIKGETFRTILSYRYFRRQNLRTCMAAFFYLPSWPVFNKFNIIFQFTRCVSIELRVQIQKNSDVYHSAGCFKEVRKFFLQNFVCKL